MKKICILILSILLISCGESKLTLIGQEIIDGNVSAIKQSKGMYEKNEYTIWVQTATETKKVEVPYSYHYNVNFKVGDHCILVIEKYKENNIR